MENEKSIQAKQLFTQLAGEPLNWSEDLQKLATSYLDYLDMAQKADHAVMVGHFTAMAVALVDFAATARWIVERASVQLRENATDVRDELLQKWRGEVISIAVCAPAPLAATATRH